MKELLFSSPIMQMRKLRHFPKAPWLLLEELGLAPEVWVPEPAPLATALINRDHCCRSWSKEACVEEGADL